MQQKEEFKMKYILLVILTVISFNTLAATVSEQDQIEFALENCPEVVCDYAAALDHIK